MRTREERGLLVADARSPSVRVRPDDPFPVGRWAWALVLLLAATAFVDSLSYHFVWDDVLMVVKNPKLRDLRNLPEFFRADFTTLTSGAIEGQYYRPTLAITLALDATLWGWNPAGFHLTNILLHVAVTYLVGRLAMAMGAGQGLAILTALLFAIHPVHVEAVTFVSARSDLLPTLGVLGSLLAYRRATLQRSRQGAWYLMAMACQVFALLSKESTITLPALLVLSDVLNPLSSGPPTDRTAWRRALVRSLPFWAVTAVFVVFRLGEFVHLVGNRIEGGNLWGRLPGSLEIFGRYIRLSLVPTHMQPFYSLPRPQSFLEPGPALGLLAAGVLVLLLAWSWRRVPQVAFAVAWFLVTVIPVLDLVPVSLREMGMTDRYLYLPSVGISLLLAQGIFLLMGPATEGGWRPRRMVGWAAVSFLLILYAWSLLRYAPIWRDNLTLYTRMEQVAPRSPNPPFNLGVTYFRANDLPRATVALERAVRLNPTLQRSRTILALLYVLQGRAADGFRLLETLASEGANNRDYYVTRTAAHLFVGDVREALSYAEEGTRRFPEDAYLTELLGRALERAGRFAEAVERYHRALTLDPDLFQAEESLGNLLVQSGRYAEAAQHFLRSAEIRPDRAQPIRALALLFETQENWPEALRLWRQVLEMAPNGAAIQEAAQHIRSLERGRTGAGTLPGGGWGS